MLKWKSRINYGSLDQNIASPTFFAIRKLSHHQCVEASVDLMFNAKKRNLIWKFFFFWVKKKKSIIFSLLKVDALCVWKEVFNIKASTQVDSADDTADPPLWSMHELTLQVLLAEDVASDME